MRKKPKGIRHPVNTWEKKGIVEVNDGTYLRDITLEKPIKHNGTPKELQKWSGTYLNQNGIQRRTKVWQQKQNGLAQLNTGKIPQSRMFDPNQSSSPRSNEYHANAETKRNNNALKVWLDKQEKHQNVRQRKKEDFTQTRKPISPDHQTGSNRRSTSLHSRPLSRH